MATTCPDIGWCPAHDQWERHNAAGDLVVFVTAEVIAALASDLDDDAIDLLGRIAATGGRGYGLRHHPPAAVLTDRQLIRSARGSLTFAVATEIGRAVLAYRAR